MSDFVRNCESIQRIETAMERENDPIKREQQRELLRRLLERLNAEKVNMIALRGGGSGFSQSHTRTAL